MWYKSIHDTLAFMIYLEIKTTSYIVPLLAQTLSDLVTVSYGILVCNVQHTRCATSARTLVCRTMRCKTKTTHCKQRFLCFSRMEMQLCRLQQALEPLHHTSDDKVVDPYKHAASRPLHEVPYIRLACTYSPGQ